MVGSLSLLIVIVIVLILVLAQDCSWYRVQVVVRLLHRSLNQDQY